MVVLGSRSVLLAIFQARDVKPCVHMLLFNPVFFLGVLGVYSAITYLSRFGLSSALSSFMNEGCRLNRRRKWRPRILQSLELALLGALDVLDVLVDRSGPPSLFAQCALLPLFFFVLRFALWRFIISSQCKWSSNCNCSGNCSANWQNCYGHVNGR